MVRAERFVLGSTLGGTDTTYLCNTGDQLTSETTGETTTTYLYDANGALTKSDDGTIVNAYTYDYDGYQTAFDTTGTSNDATYTYDADKRRINKVVDSVTTKYFLDGANVIADYDADNALVATYVTPGLDNNISVTRSGNSYYYMKDGLGSIRNVVDSSEATQNTYDYYAFGKELGTWTQNVTNRYTYTAREYDAEAKQYYYRARYYGSFLGFLSRDSVEPFGYTYCVNSPTDRTDAYGLNSECGWFDGIACAAAESAIGALVTGHTDDAWTRYASGVGGTVQLSESDMTDVFSVYHLRKKMVDPLVGKCRTATTSASYTDAMVGNANSYNGSRYLYYYGDSGWGAALGGVSFYLTGNCTICEGDRTLKWTITMNDEWDFDNWRSGVTQLPRNAIVMPIKMLKWGFDCNWKNFFHAGSISGEEKL